MRDTGSHQRVFFMRDTGFSSEDILYERYRFSSEGIRYLIVLVGPYVGNATKRSRAQCVCVSLRCLGYIFTEPLKGHGKNK